MRVLFVAAAVLLGMSAQACVPLESETITGELPPCEWADVVSVTDGDTIVVELDGREERVRYIGIDTPETGGFQQAEPLGKEATARNRELLDDGRVCLEKDVSETDRFGRLLRYPWLEDGRMVSTVLLDEGLAEVVEFPPDLKYHESLLDPAQWDAQAAELGIWGE
ncbi:MAG: thermonuclease family protein [Dehalococcoidia bacterium]|nr:thermonuclease family protein [Dehalococcoidia bacterium]